MSSQTAVLVWLSAASLLPTFRADLDGYAQSRFLRLEAPRENAPSFRGAAYAPDAVAEVEALLEEARSATASLEQSRALDALEHAAALVHDHPELPQAAWLLAEELELRADIEASAPEGASSARALRKRAAALEGPRATPFSDHTPSPELDLPPARTLTVDGLAANDELEWDGALSTSSLSGMPGEHHARVLRGGRLLWAGWVNLPEGETRVRFPVPESPPCSADDIGSAHLAGGRAFATPSTRCESYVLASARPGGGIEAAQCERNVCGKVVIFQRGARTPVGTAASERSWPRWATYTLVAAGGVLATGAVLWRAGVFDRKTPATTVELTYMGQQKPMRSPVAGRAEPFGFPF